MLTAEQIQHYRQQGYLALTGALPVSETETLRRAAERIVDEFDIDAHRSIFSTADRDRGRDDYFMDSAEAVHCFLEEDALGGDGRLTKPKHLAINKIGHALHDRIPEFNAFCRLPLFGQALRDLGYRAPVLWQTMYIFKQPHIGGEVRWHQDASYLISRPASVMGIWVALEDATRENGCLWVQPGGHRSPLREIYEVDPVSRGGELRTIDETPWPTKDDGVPLEVPRGSLVFFHDHMPHYSSKNRSDRSRHAFTLHVGEAASEWPKSNWLQRPELGPFAL
jgi:phytanoyl-CoA hydroxylase